MHSFTHLMKKLLAGLLANRPEVRQSCGTIRELTYNRGRRFQFPLYGTVIAIAAFSVIALAATSSTLAQEAGSTASSETDLDELTAQWWQWALSIPTSVNPLEDTTGANCMVGQSNPVWFLAGFFNGSAATRSCSVPEGAALFFPVINAINFNTPNVCGQGPASISVTDLRAVSASFIAGASNLSVSVDSQPVTTLKHIKSIVFDVALPGDNVFNALCGGPGTVPANIYSPAVDDGIYVLLKPLKVGQRMLHFHAENVSQSFVEDITYVLTVVPTESE